ncbi:META domain-containing protein [Oryzibacter oryziterrae]|uniref:META domain-containing protein n=1 Tax=Oryzibacter oryziterrae TaxID=2766474 RepID=UPI001F333A8C|nr:META domain-containing protein [Oryzibacter oryziterrae]
MVRWSKGNWAALSLALLTVAACQAEGFDMKWRVTRIEGVELNGIVPTLSLDGDKVTGFAGCNRLTGNADLQGSKVRFSGLATTRMACKGPAMAVERALLQALETRAVSVELGENSAKLLDAEGKAVVDLARAD